MIVLLIVRFVLFCVLLSLMFAGYYIINDKDPVEVIKKSMTPTQTSDVFSMKAPDPDPKALGYCVIEPGDLFSGSVYDYDKKQLPSKMSPVPCSKCNQYIYKTSNTCSSYMYDSAYNALAPNIDDSSKFSVFCDPAHPERGKNCIQPHGVCSLNVDVSKTCNF